MKSSEFNNRKEIVDRYFRHPRWECKNNDDWEYEYYKGKRNIEELENAINIVFDFEANIIEKCWLYNSEKEIVGGTIICSFYVSPDFNGINQGSGLGEDVYVAFNLARYGFFYNQSDNLKDLRK